MSVKAFLLAATASLIFLANANAAVFAIQSDISDYEALNNGGTSTGVSGNVRIGTRTVGATPTLASPILSFALPAIPGGEQIVSATLTISMINQTSNLPTSNADLYGLPLDPAPVDAPSGALHFTGANDGTAGVTKLQDDFLVPANASAATGTTFTSADISAFITSLYTGGGVAGDFAVLRLSYDAVGSLAVLNRYLIGSSGTVATPTTSNFPVLTITTAPIPEPATAGLALLGGLGVLLRRRRV